MATEWPEDQEGDLVLAPAKNMSESTDPPMGEQLFFIAKVTPREERQRVETYASSQPGDIPRKAAYFSLVLNVELRLKSDPSKTISDSFFVPPEDSQSWSAYFRGKKEDGKADGWRANKFVQFIERIGFPWESGQPMPELARRPKNWLNRTVFAKVEQGDEYTDSKGKNRQGRLQIAMFSYREANESGQPPPQSQPAAAAANPRAQTAPRSREPEYSSAAAASLTPGFGTDLGEAF